jgi:diguanylate cyclase (GGDEF)-like protein
VNYVETIEKNRLLIVDDDSSNLMALSHILGSEYIIHVAANGEAAVKMAENFIPDLILLDIILPGMDGYEVFNELQNLDKTAHIPIIFITGLNNKDDEKKGLRMGAVDYISKPFDDVIVKLRVQHQIRIINQLRIIERLSMIDQLTGIPNRRNFDNRLRIEWARAVRESTSVSLLMVDVDYFKNYNDTYGHQQGDAALKMVAERIHQTLGRMTDFAARWGGEEFVVLIPGTDFKGACEIGERIRENIENTETLCVDGTVTKVTVSVGVNTHMPLKTSSIDEFISNADRALYSAKNMGRNRVCCYDETKGRAECG